MCIRDSPNGIAMSADRRHVYVAETTDGILNLYERDAETGELSQKGLRRGRFHAGAGLDNITVDEAGGLWIVAHPRLFDYVKHSKDNALDSATRTLRIELDAEAGKAEIEDVYVGDGEQLSGGTIAVPVGDAVVMGSVFEKKILICDLPS